MAETTTQATSGTRLVSRVTCPHCWHRFPPEDVLWIAQHDDLMGDMLLADQHQRFLPSRFTPQGDAIDARDVVCHNLACPHCHLSVPRGMLESEPLFLSILGAPYSGKSYFLAAAMWKLRETLTTTFGISFRDADPVANAVLTRAEEQLFLNPDSEKVFLPGDLIAKTVEFGGGSMSDDITHNGHTVTYPRPYIFSLQLNDRHPNAARGGWDQTLCLYDNAGEHWRPGSDTPRNHITRHLAQSRVLMYLFDPMQDRRFRDAARKRGPELQLPGDFLGRQETILNEASSRIRRYCGLPNNAKIDRPLIMVVPKFDAWGHLLTPMLEGPIPEQPWGMSASHPVAVLRVNQIERVSKAMKTLMEQYCPETVAAAESLTSRVTYIPMSVLNEGIAKDPATGNTGIRPGSIRPFWTPVPFLYALQLASPTLIARTKPTT